MPHMPNLTKQDIDALVDGLVPSRIWPGAVKLDSKPGGWIKDADELKRQLYVSAGLPATGERKPERVRCWLVAGSGSTAFWAYHPDEMNEQVPKGASVTPGWFVPDGAE